MARGLIRLSSEEDTPAPTRQDAPALTPRQLAVLRLIAEGKNAREIGSELYLSKSTIRNHTRALLQAFGAHSQLELLARRMSVLQKRSRETVQILRSGSLYRAASVDDSDLVKAC